MNGIDLRDPSWTPDVWLFVAEQGESPSGARSTRRRASLGKMAQRSVSDFIDCARVTLYVLGGDGKRAGQALRRGSSRA